METNNNPMPPVFNPGQQQQQQQQQQPPYYNQPVRELPQMTFGDAVKTCFAKYADFSGRARRSEFWYWQLFQMLCGWAASFIFMFFGTKTMLVASLLLGLALLCPLLAVQTRRLHDIGRSGIIVGITAFFYLALQALALKIYWPIMDLAESDPMGFINSLQESMGTMGMALGLASLAYSILMLILLIYNLQDSDRNENKYGPSPKYQ